MADMPHASHLPSLGTSAPRDCKPHCGRMVIPPNHGFCRLWRFVLAIFAFAYTTWVPLFVFGFLKSSEGWLWALDIFEHVLFIVNIFLTPFVAYLDEDSNLLVDDHIRILQRYLVGWFSVDAFSSFMPLFGRYRYHHDDVRHRSYDLFRLARVLHIFFRLEENIDFNYYWARCAKLLYVAVFIVHVEACVFHFAADCMGHDKAFFSAMKDGFANQTLPTHYLVTVYWSITTFTTIGYGDIHPINPIEYGLTITFMMINFALSSYVTSNMTNLIDMSARLQKFRAATEEVRNFARRNKLPNDLRDKMIEDVSLQYRIDSKAVQQDFIVNFNPRIRATIARNLYLGLINRVYLFRDLTEQIKTELVSMVRAKYFPARTELFSQGESALHLYIVVTGSLRVSRSGQEENLVMDAVCAEDDLRIVVGEIEVLCDIAHLFNVRCETNTQLLSISRTDLVKFFKRHAMEAQTIMRILLEHHVIPAHDPTPLVNEVINTALEPIRVQFCSGIMDPPCTRR